jgi:nucleotide-binding universal stress UspA family protein
MVVEGDATMQIDAVAAEQHADLIVMGTHGQRAIRRAFLGSVAEAVVRSAPCPVLTVHEPTPSHEALGAETPSGR